MKRHVLSLGLPALALTALFAFANPAAALCIGGSMCGGQLTNQTNIESQGHAWRDGGNFQGAGAAGQHTRTTSWGNQGGNTATQSGSALGTVTNGCPNGACGSVAGLAGSTAVAQQHEHGGSAAMARGGQMATTETLGSGNSNTGASAMVRTSVPRPSFFRPN